MYITNFDGFDLSKYNDFLIECSFKDYSNQGTQQHHIIPKKIMGGTDDASNLITLNYEDHYKAHLILADCFPPKHIYRGKNYASAVLVLGFVKGYLQKKYGVEYTEKMPDFWDRAHSEVSELLRGENHPMFGIKLSPELCEMMSRQRKGTNMGSDNPFYNKKHTDESRKKIKEARAKQIFSDETKKKQINALISNIKRGAANPTYGKIWSEIYTPEQLEKMLTARTKYFETLKNNKLQNLPNNIFQCDCIIDGKYKNFYRICTECESFIYYHSPNLNLYHIKKAEKNNTLCKSCTSNKKLNTDWGKFTPKDHIKLYRFKSILDTTTQILYPTKKRLMFELKIKGSRLSTLIKTGRFIIINDNYTKHTEIS